MDLAYGQGVIQSTNEDGNGKPAIRINSQPKPSGPIPLYGYGKWKAPACVDKFYPRLITRATRSAFPALVTATIQRDGRFAIGRNLMKGVKALLGYDREQTQADQDRAYKIKEIEARLCCKRCKRQTVTSGDRAQQKSSQTTQ